jgi:hypothetical protein
MARRPYPLQWPPGSRRTSSKERVPSSFGRPEPGRFGRSPPSAYETAKELHAELGRLGAANAVITSQLPTRHDGLPYADGRSEDPGIAVWFVLDGHERVFACDKWCTPGENLRAIAKSIEALRGLERWGMADVVSKAFAGFAALPSGAPAPPVKRDWREVFGVEALVDTLLASSTDDLIAVVKARHRKLIAEHHPDAGGDVARAAELNAALDEAEKELSP